MALRKNTNPAPMQLHPELQDLLVRNGMEASIVMSDTNPRLLVRGHDSPVLSYDLTKEQVRKLTDWGSNFSNKTAYGTLTAIVAKDFDMPKDFVHARNANGRVAMGLHGYRIGAGEYGRPTPLSTRQAIYAGMPLAPRCYGHRDRAHGFLGRLTGWLGWTPRQQEGFHLRRIGGGLYVPNGAPMVPDRPDGRMKPGELQSGGYGFYYKGQTSGSGKDENPNRVKDPLNELKEVFVPMPEKAERPKEPAKPYKELVSSPVYFTSEKFLKCLSSHGIVVDTVAKTLTLQPEQTSFDLQYDLTENELERLTSNSLKEIKLEERLAIINSVIVTDFERPVTVEMLNSKKRLDIPLKQGTVEDIVRKEAEQREGLEETQTEVQTETIKESVELRVEKGGKVIPIITEMEGHHWEQDVRGGRDVVVRDVVAYENGGEYFLRAEVNGNRFERVLMEEQFKELYYRTDEVRIGMVDKLLDGISFKNGDYKGEVVNADGTDASRLSEMKDSKRWFREGKDGREVNVGHIGVQAIEGGRYIMKGLIDGEVLSRDISKKEYNKFLAMDDYHRMKMFSKMFEEVDMKERLGLGARISAALAAGVTVMGELTLGEEPGERYHRPYGPTNQVRAYYKLGVDTLEEVAMRNFEAAVNTEKIQNGLRK